jgi:hypothetical protein
MKISAIMLHYMHFKTNSPIREGSCVWEGMRQGQGQTQVQVKGEKWNAALQTIQVCRG